jgi:hypothetical protein
LERLAKITNEGTVRLDVLQSHVKQLRRGVTVTEIGKVAQQQLRELLNLSEAACQAVVQQSILESLAFSDMYGRFEEVEKAHFNTFRWLYDDKTSSENDDSVLGSLYPYDSDDGQALREDSSTGHQPRHEDDVDTSPQESRSNEEEDLVSERQPQKNNKVGEDDAHAQREKWTNWLSSGNGIFHIAGKLGSGKSTLMKLLCNHPQTRVALQKWAGMIKIYEKNIRYF